MQHNSKPSFGRSRPRTTRVLAAAAFAVTVLVGGACSPAADRETLLLAGSSTLAPVITKIAQRFEHAHPGVRVDVQSGGSSRGLLDIRSGLADIAMVSRGLVGTEQSLHAYTVARDGVAIILNAKNPVAALSEAQVAAIYTGEVENWKALGGRDAKIVVVHKAAGRATLEVFLDYFGLENEVVRPDVIVGENEQAVKTVAGNPDAIGYVSIGTAAIDIEHGVPIRLLGIGGVAATLENLRSDIYPIARPLNLVTVQPVSGLARMFIDFVRSAQIRPFIEAQHFVQVGRVQDDKS